SSRRRHTSFSRDWSSDVCSSDLPSYTVRANGSGSHPSGTKWVTDAAEFRSITQAEAATLQTFPADFSWQGTKGKQFQQIGNAIPPLLAEAVLAAVTA